MHHRVPAFLATILLAVACAAPSSLPRYDGRLHLKLEGLFPRHTQFLEATTQARLSVEGPGISPLTQTAAVDGDTVSVTLENLPSGAIRLITLELCNEQGQPLPLARYRVATALHEGDNTATLSSSTTASGEVVATLLKDKSSVLSNLDLVTLQQKINQIKTLTAHYGLIDSEAIAHFLENGGNLASLIPDPQWVDPPGSLKVKLRGLPSGMQGAVWLDDPVSPKQTVYGNGDLLLEPVKPGTWTLRGNLRNLTATVSVDVKAGQNEATLTFGSSWQTGTALPYALAAAGTATFSDRLVLAGGMRWESADQFSKDGITRATTSNKTLFFDGSLWSTGPDLPVETCYPVAIQDSSRLFLLGGLNRANPTGLKTTQMLHQTGGNWAWQQLADTPGIPVAGGMVGNKLFYCGMDDQLQTFATVYELDPGAPGASWQSVVTLPNLLPRIGCAYASVDGKLYLISGVPSADYYRAGTVGSVPSVRTVEVYDPVGKTVRACASIPTPRFGATALVQNGKIWVVGGSDHLGQPLSTVEVYDPLHDSWELRSPLNLARTYPALGLLQGKFWAIGGMLGMKGLLFFPDYIEYGFTGLEDENALLDAVESLP